MYVVRVNTLVVVSVVLRRRRGELKIILSICRWVRRSLSSSCFVNVQELLPYSTVGVTVPSKSRQRPLKE